MARAAITKCPRLGGLNNRHFCFLTILEARSLEVKVAVGLVSPEVPFLGL